MASKTTTYGKTSGAFNKLYISRKILVELLENQGFNIDNVKNFSNNDIHIMAKNTQLDLFLTNDTNNQKIYVKYYILKELRPQNVNDIIDELFVIEELLHKGDQLLIITKSYINDTMKNELEKIWSNTNIYVNLLSISELQFNILNHEMVPKHIKLNDTEKQAFLEKYNIYKTERIPEISRFDPVAKVIGLQPGDVCKIIRPSRTSIQGVYYRICINS
jgi:DNA-directed RNA polymerase subunit H (RpoH/RPB5)